VSTNIKWHDHKISSKDREEQLKQKPFVLWFTGLSGSGKSTIAGEVEYQLHQQGYKTYLLDGDNVRHGLNSDLAFSNEDREENIRRVSEVAKLFVDAGLIVITAFITPFEKDREKIRKLIGSENLVEVFVDCDLEVCESRDPKGLYKKARKGEIKSFTGIDSKYEKPENPSVILPTNDLDINGCVKKLLDYIDQRFH
jgi:adenylylsulfate kinase